MRSGYALFPLLLLASGPAYSGPFDPQPFAVSADAVEYRANTEEYVFAGNVIVDWSSARATGDSATLRSRPETDPFTPVVVEGNPATFTYEDRLFPLRGSARTLKLLPDRVVLQGEARISTPDGEAEGNALEIPLPPPSRYGNGPEIPLLPPSRYSALREAALAGDADAAWELAKALAKGSFARRQIAPDLDAAEYWLVRAAQNRHPQASEVLRARQKP